MSDAVLVGSIPKARGEELQVNLSEYEGRRFLDLRTYYAAGDKHLPTKKGATVGLHQIGELIAILQKAQAHIAAESRDHAA